ncbi:MAG: hypothetical protein JJE04_10575 [Acidobacteriia bacterium]|nr:hypothetical protein [Terriglobia bacterium]
MKFALALLLSLPLSAATPCATATPGCTEKVPLGGRGRYSLIYRNHPLDTPNPGLKHALIVIHGVGRNADWYFASGMAGAFLAGAVEDTMVIAPRFASGTGGGCRDVLLNGEISWPCSGWTGGEAAPDLPGVFSYALIDTLVRHLGDRKRFPAIEQIVIVGHSAGGQFMHRYLAVTGIIKEVEIPVRFIVANPSSYLYLDAIRPAEGVVCTKEEGCKGEFTEFKGASCGNFDLWKYGMVKRTGYAAKVADEDLRSNMIGRDVTYLLGEWDNLPGNNLDASCSGMAQGPNRLMRGLNYYNYIRSRHKASHKVVTVPSCGHNARCMFTSDAALPVLFPR